MQDIYSGNANFFVHVGVPRIEKFHVKNHKEMSKVLVASEVWKVTSTKCEEGGAAGVPDLGLERRQAGGFVSGGHADDVLGENRVVLKNP